MRLVSVDGRSVQLSIVDYEFDSRPADAAPSATFDDDENWLVIAGRLELPDSRRHAFTEPCLLTVEAVALADWLDAAAARPSGCPPPSDAPDLAFIEPNLAFALEAVMPDVVILRVYLSFEAAPPWPVDGDTGFLPNYVRLAVRRSELAAAARQWRDETHRFPRR